MARKEVAVDVILDTGWYTGTLAMFDQGEGQFGEFVRLVAKLDNGVTKTFIANWPTGPISSRSNLGKWIKGMLGGEIPKDYVFDTTNFEEKRFDFHLVEDENMNGEEINRLTKVRPSSEPDPNAGPIPFEA